MSLLPKKTKVKLIYKLLSVLTEEKSVLIFVKSLAVIVILIVGKCLNFNNLFITFILMCIIGDKDMCNILLDKLLKKNQ